MQRYTIYVVINLEVIQTFSALYIYSSKLRKLYMKTYFFTSVPTVTHYEEVRDKKFNKFCMIPCRRNF